MLSRRIMLAAALGAIVCPAFDDVPSLSATSLSVPGAPAELWPEVGDGLTG